MKYTVLVPPSAFTPDGGDVGKLTEWYKRIGDAVEPGEALAIVDDTPVSCPVYGILHKKMVLPGDAVEVGEPLAVLSGVAPALVTGRETMPEAWTFAPVVPPRGVEDPVLLSPARQALARHDARAFADVPHVFTHARVDVSEALRLAQKGGGLLLAFVLASVAVALKRYPDLNGYLASPSEMRRRQYLHIGVLCPLSNGEIAAPVVRNADTKSPLALTRELIDLQTRAQNGTLTRPEQTGATFIVREDATSGVWQTGILPQPQTGLLTFCAPENEVVALETGSVAARLVSHLCLVHDARTASGREAAAFLRDIKTGLEEARFLFT